MAARTEQIAMNAAEMLIKKIIATRTLLLRTATTLARYASICALTMPRIPSVLGLGNSLALIAEPPRALPIQPASAQVLFSVQEVVQGPSPRFYQAFLRPG
jgi:hypothetical protein